MRADGDFLWGLAHNPEMVDRMDSNSLARRERSTLFGMLRRWPYMERRCNSGAWDGRMRRSSDLGHVDASA